MSFMKNIIQILLILVSFSSFSAECDLYLDSSSYSAFKMKQTLTDIGFDLVEDKNAPIQATLVSRHSISLTTGQFVRYVNLKITEGDKVLLKEQGFDAFPLYLFAYHDLKKKILDSGLYCF